MHEIEQWIEEAARSQNLSLRKLPERDAILVEDAARAHYVRDHPCVWWLGLSKPISQRYDSRSVNLLSVVLQKTGTCRLIPETESEHLPVYEVEVSQVEMIIRECPFFEYNLVAMNFSWLVVETDHNEFYICRDIGFGQ